MITGRGIIISRPGQFIGPDASPTFVTIKLSALTDNYIPYHVNDTTGLANGPIKTDVDSAISLKHAAGSDFLVMQVLS